MLINDSYYLDKSDAKVKRILNFIGNITHTAKSDDQYYKNLDIIFSQFQGLFRDEKKLFEIFELCIEDTLELGNLCDFEIETGVPKLPVYEMNEEDKKKYKDNDDLFTSLIAESDYLKDKGQEYFDRVEEEYRVIKKGGFIDYFLTLWDILRFCRENKILYGLGRGSVAGSAISCALRISKIDPIPYGLIFERFLNEARIEKEGLKVQKFKDSRYNNKISCYYKPAIFCSDSIEEIEFFYNKFLYNKNVLTPRFGLKSHRLQLPEVPRVHFRKVLQLHIPFFGNDYLS